MSPARWDHTELPGTRHKWMCPTCVTDLIIWIVNHWRWPFSFIFGILDLRWNPFATARHWLTLWIVCKSWQTLSITCNKLITQYKSPEVLNIMCYINLQLTYFTVCGNKKHPLKQISLFSVYFNILLRNFQRLFWTQFAIIVANFIISTFVVPK